jgi:hypothetical protein
MEKLLKTDRLHTSPISCLSMHNVSFNDSSDAEGGVDSEGGATEGLLICTGQDSTSLQVGSNGHMYSTSLQVGPNGHMLHYIMHYALH